MFNCIFLIIKPLFLSNKTSEVDFEIFAHKILKTFIAEKILENFSSNFNFAAFFGHFHIIKSEKKLQKK